MTPYTSIAIRIVRFPLAVLVVFIHSVGPTDNIAYYPFRDFFSHTFCSFVVPAFFIISGFLFFQRMENGFTKKIYIKKLNSRISTLLIPYFVWNAVTLVIDLLKFYIGRPSWIDYGNASIGEIIVHCFWGNVSDISSGIYYPINLPLWYIRDLIVLCLFSPIIYKICDKFGWFTIVALTVSYFLGLHLLYFNLLGILFFSLGAFLAIHNRNLVYDKWYYMCPIIIIGLIVYIMTGQEIILKLYIFTMPFFIFFLCSKIRKAEKIASLGKYSTVIYYSHYPLTLIVAFKIVGLILPCYSLINYFIIPLLAVLLSIMLCEILSSLRLKYGKRKN